MVFGDVIGIGVCCLSVEPSKGGVWYFLAVTTWILEGIPKAKQAKTGQNHENHTLPTQNSWTKPHDDEH